MAIKAVSQFGMRMASASPAPAMIISNGNSVIDKKWTIRACPTPAYRQFPQPPMPALKGGLTVAMA
jgi:hypothetical protein